MSKGTNQKLKLSYLTKIMLAKTDDEHSLTMPQIIDELKKYDITAERKSIYTDIEDITDKLGIEIIKEQIGRETFYHVASRDFELAEVKLLIDAIQSSKFITQKKSRTLIDKIKGLVSEHQAKQLQRQVFITDRVKNMNESVYYNVDAIHTAINNNHKIRFRYFKWDVTKELVPRHGGEYFTISPWALTWNDENYYLIAFDDWAKKIKHYRVDKMMNISVLEEVREGKKAFKESDIMSYCRTRFGMFDGEMKKVQIQFDNDICSPFFDRFGQDIIIHKVDEKHSEVMVDVAVSSQFLGWMFALGEKAKVIGPPEVMEQMSEALEKVLECYK